jgi:hypothetical protein
MNYKCNKPCNNLEGGTQLILNKANNVFSNNMFTIIICLLLAFFSARVSQGFILPSKLYYLFDNIIIKIISLVVIICILQFNIPIGVMLILSYILLMISYNKQNSVEKFENRINIL